MPSSLTLHVVTPVTGMGLPPAPALTAALGPDVSVVCSAIGDGPASIECELDQALAVPGTLAAVRSAARAGADAVVINCMGDPGLDAARELTSVPVLGTAQTSMHVAAMLGHRFSILTVVDQLIHVDEAKAASYGLGGRLASVRSVGIPVLDLGADAGHLLAALTEQGLQAVRDDGAHVLVLGCTGMLGLAADLARALVHQGVSDVPVVDPLPVTLHVAAALARSGLSHSKRTYPCPPGKPRPGYEAVLGTSSAQVG
jgi:allantoin racemase